MNQFLDRVDWEFAYHVQALVSSVVDFKRMAENDNPDIDKYQIDAIPIELIN